MAFIHSLSRFIRNNLLFLIYLSLSAALSTIIYRALSSYIQDDPELNVSEPSADFTNFFERFAEKQQNTHQFPPKFMFSRDYSQHYEILTDIQERPLGNVECFGKSASDRICRVRNLCYSPGKDKFFIFREGKDAKSVKEILKKDDEDRILDLTTINNHNVFYFELEDDFEFGETELAQYKNSLRWVNKKTFVFARFVYDNVMHNIHDDYLGQYLLHRKFSPKRESPDSFDNISRDNLLFFTDGMSDNPQDHLFASLTEFTPFRRSYLNGGSNLDRSPICFAEAIVGNSKQATWYEYGFFGEPQGPIQKKVTSGTIVRSAAKYLMKFNNVPVIDQQIVNSALKSILQNKKITVAGGKPQFYISIFSRTLDRLILNQEEMISELKNRFNLPVRLVQLERLTFPEVLEIMSKTLVAVGLHGSALIFGIFMPKNAVMVEMFPFAVPAENYIPYRTMAWLPGMDLTYRSWTNLHESKTFPQTGQRRNFYDFNEDKLAKVLGLKTVPPHLCCSDIYWIFRIYQDTIIHIPELIRVVEDGLRESLSQKEKASQLKWLKMSARRVDDVASEFYSIRDLNGVEKVNLLAGEIYWENPWIDLTKTESEPNAFVPSQYGVWLDYISSEVFVKLPLVKLELCQEGSTVGLWIRPYRWDSSTKQHIPSAPYSRKFEVKCELKQKEQ